MHEEDGMGLPKDWQPQVKVAENEMHEDDSMGLPKDWQPLDKVAENEITLVMS